MNETSTDEQVVAKALDTPVFPANDFSTTNDMTIIQSGTASAQGVVPVAPVALAPASTPGLSLGSTGLPNQPAPNHEFPKITPIHDSSDIYYKPQGKKVATALDASKVVAAPFSTDNKTVNDAGAGVAPLAIDIKTESVPETNAVSLPPTNEIVQESTAKPEGLSSGNDSPLNEIKKVALSELRPLVDKLTVSPEDKFDTLLLMIRSTDDSSLIQQAHEAAKLSEDESKRAEALLEIIKEIDYLSHQNKAN